MTATMSNPPQQTSIANNDVKAEHTMPSSNGVAQDVGFIFVREYYTFLSKKPERLHAFYAKDSLYLRGNEGDYVYTYYGQNAIQSKIKELGFEDCKVLVTQVDSQASANDGIIIQVIGEMRNRSVMSQKFCQTIFLARQQNGYHVLNDVFRFLREPVNIDNYIHEEQLSTPARQQTPPPPPKREEMIDDIHKEDDLDDVDNEAMSNSRKNPEPAVAKPIMTPIRGTRAPESEEGYAIGAAQMDRTEGNASEARTPAKEDDDGINGVATAASTIVKEPRVNIKDSKTTSYPSSPEKEPGRQQQSEQQQKPNAAKTWANLAADQFDKWGTQVAETKGTMVVAPGNPSTKSQQQQSEAIPASAPTPNFPTHKQPHSHNSRDQRRGEEGAHIFIKGVGQHIQENHLREAFVKFGVVKAITVLHSRSCAFLDFMTADAARRALHQHKVNIGSHVVLAEERRHGGGGSGSRHQHNRQQQQNGRRFQQDGGGHRRGGVPRGGKSRGTSSNSQK